MDLEKRIELYLKESGHSAARAGRDALNDPRFVYELRRGRQVRERTSSRVHEWLDRQGAKR